jgi:S-disulfanyl-L-cysteine oxidoreductase SoxD
MCSWRSAMLAALLAIPTSAPNAAGTARFGFGVEPSPAQIAAWDIDVRPDGRGLPPGKGSVAQGQDVYDAKCANCHGTFGESNDYMQIAGGVGSLSGSQPIRTTGSKLNHATTLWDYINRAMPFQAPKTLTADEVYALTAYVLHLNDILPADGSLDQISILAVQMPNRAGFTTAHGFGSVRGTPDTKNVACMRDCGPAPKLASEIPDHARDAHGDLRQQLRSGPTAASTAATSTKAVPVAGLAKTAGCLACHAVAGKLVGPSFREVRTRYAHDAGAGERLVARVKQGGAGNWGSIPMPAHPQLADADARALVAWILAP